MQNNHSKEYTAPILGLEPNLCITISKHDHVLAIAEQIGAHIWKLRGCSLPHCNRVPMISFQSTTTALVEDNDDDDDAVALEEDDGNVPLVMDIAMVLGRRSVRTRAGSEVLC